MVTGVQGYEFGLLGPLSGRHDGRELDLGSPLQRAVLVRLLLAQGRQCGLDHLIDALWEEPPVNAVRSVQTYVYRIRLSLGEERSRLETMPDGYQLDIPEQAVDALRFERLAREGEALRAARQAGPSLRAFDAALALWSGEPLSGVPGPYVQRYRRRVAELRLNAQVAQLECADELGEHARVATELVSLIADHPLREDLYALRMRALYHSGRAAEALAVYAAARETMVAELGMDPGPELRELQARILSGAEADSAQSRPGGPRAGVVSLIGDTASGVATTAPSAGVTTPAGATASTGAATTRVEDAREVPEALESLEAPQAPEIPQTPTGLRPQQLPPAPGDFVGRERLRERLRLALRPSGEAVAISVLSGIGGVGKTALALRVAHGIRGDYPDGQLYVDLRGDGGQPADPADVLVDFLLALGMPAAAIPATPTARAGAYRTLTADRRILVLLDNASDTAQVTPLLPGTPGNAALITTRHRSLVPPGATRFEVPVPDQQEAVAMLGRFTGDAEIAAAPELARELVSACGQLPLALRIIGARAAARPGRGLGAQLLRLRAEEHQLDELRAGGLSVEATFQVGYRALAPVQARAMRLCALLDAADFPVAVAAVLLDQPEAETEEQLEHLVEAGLLEPHSADRYRFHDLVRAFAARRAHREDSVAEREAALVRLTMFLHATLLQAMSATERAGSLATHLFSVPLPGLRFAGADQARTWLLAEHTLLVAVFSRVLRDIPDASRLVVAALSVIASSGLFAGPAHQRELERLSDQAVAAADPGGDLAWQAQTRHIRAWLAFIRGDLTAAETDLREAIRCERAVDDPVPFFMSTRLLSVVLADQGRTPEAVEFFAESEAVAGSEDDPNSPAYFALEVGRLFTALSSDQAEVNISAAQHVYEVSDRLRRAAARL
ncbi:AfsR family transcriptional regulator [Streptomyces sp. uw30]|uniref:AfsR/SARP family transcriptional regulator n=1 Tax=Streptomyces sp. uw30 TaxID=1828179 RepID=UPI0011CDFE94|nr:AfsR/SARP family transcriptional regulator [Streptomyces sp. uw30]TXS44200.1 AfsR family transcriptional regulator [Streptomyces sp. uw30]